MQQNKNYLLGIYTRSPLHIGSGTSVDIVDLPIIRERITNYPVIPASALKGVLRQRAVDLIGERSSDVNILFGNRDDDEFADGKKNKTAYAGAMFFGEAKLLAFPVRSLKECFAWITCPLVLQRFVRDTGKNLNVPKVDCDRCFAPDKVASKGTVVLEEYPLTVYSAAEYQAVEADIKKIVDAIADISDDPVWKGELADRLVITNDENFQHFVTTTTEIVARIEIDPKKRTNKNLFNQENAPSESVYYSVCQYLGERKPGMTNACETFGALFPNNKACIQLGGNETIGQGLCEVKLTLLNGGE